MSKHTPIKELIIQHANLVEIQDGGDDFKRRLETNEDALLEAYQSLEDINKDMFAALEELRDLFGNWDDVRIQAKSIPAEFAVNNATAKADAAIAKARGEA